MKKQILIALLWAWLAWPVFAGPDVSVKISDQGSHHVDIRRMSNGEVEIKTLGDDPFIVIEVEGQFDPKKTPYLSFDYFCPDGISGPEIFYADPFQPSRRVQGDNLPKAEAWQPGAIEIYAASDGTWSSSDQRMRFDLGTSRHITIRLRNLRLRPPTENDLRSAEHKAAIRAALMEDNRLIREYLDTKFPCTIDSVALKGEDLQIRIDSGSTNTSGLILAEAPIWSEPWKLLSPDANKAAKANVVSVGTLVSIGIKKGNRYDHITLPRMHGGRDRLTSRWVLIQHRDERAHLASHAVYLDDCSFPDAAKVKRHKYDTVKGLGGVSWREPVMSDLIELGIRHITINIGSGWMIGRGQDGIAWEFAGKTWYFNRDTIERYDKTMRFCREHDIQPSLIILITWGNSGVPKLLNHPEADRAGHYPMPNLTSRAGAEAYGAMLSFLGARYGNPNGPYGRALNWIMHNEIDAGWVWTNMGQQPILRFMDTYIRSMRYCHLLARQYDPGSRTYVSLTHHWTLPFDKNPLRGYTSRALLETLTDYSKAEGDFEWGVAIHPYPESLYESATWNDTKIDFSFNTPLLTPKNLEVMDAYMEIPSMLYRGNTVRSLMFSEQGFNTRDYSEAQQRQQAAAYVYLWHKLRNMRNIDSFQNHGWFDHAGEGGLLLGLRTLRTKENPWGTKKKAWHIYRAIDTPEEAEATDFAKEIIGIEDFSEIPYRGAIK
jgi:hypothetical protein